MNRGTADAASKNDVLRLGLTIFVVSAGLVLYEINLVRLFSIVIRNVSFFVLGVALFGYGLGGLYAQMLSRDGAAQSPASLKRTVFWLALLTAAAMVLGVVILAVVPVGRPGRPAPIPLWLSIGLLFTGASLPFMCGSMLMAKLFASRPEEAPRLYFGDLMGAALACLCAVAVFSVLGGFAMPFATAGVLLVLAATYGWERQRFWLAVAGLVAAAWLGFVNLQSGLIRVTPEGDLHKREFLFSGWNFYSWITVEEDVRWRGWRLSSAYEGPDPEYLVIRQDGHAPAWITRFDGDYDKVAHLRYDVTALPYRVFDPQHALVIGAGGGRDILTAKAYDTPRVTAVELNAITANAVMRGAFRDYSGNVYGLDNVEIAIENGRTYMERTRETYDLVYTSLADTLLGNSEGVFVLSENHLYTVEAFSAYLDRLNPGGFACIIYSALTEGHLLPRFLNTCIEALRRHGVTEPEKHILAMMTPDPPGEVDEGVCIMFGKSPVTEAMTARALEACADLRYFLAWPPAGPPNEWTDQVARMLDPKRRAKFEAESYFDVSPLHDDRPYLFYVTKPGDFINMLLHPWETAAKIPVGLSRMPFLIDLFFVVLALVFLLMVSPLLLFRRADLAGGRPEQLVFLALFLLLGMAYMLIEVGFLQRLFLFLGNPTLTFAVTLGVMLFFTGCGSYLSRNIPDTRLWRWLALCAAAAVVVQIAVHSVATPVLCAAMGFPLPVRILISFAFLAALATPMGMLFPTCMRLLARLKLNMVCWAWGMNGVGSVVGTVGASLVAINLGMRAVFLAGIACYAVFVLVSLIGIAFTARWETRAGLR